MNPNLRPHNAESRRQGLRSGYSEDEDEEEDEDEDDRWMRGGNGGAVSYLDERILDDDDDEEDHQPLGLRSRMVRRGSEGPEVKSGMAIQRDWEEQERERIVAEYEWRRGLR